MADADFTALHEALQAEFEKAKAAHPRLGLSFGYIGNYWTDGRAQPDDSEWFVWSKVQARTQWDGYRHMYYGGFATARLDDFLAVMRGPRFELWLDRVEAQFDKNVTDGCAHLNPQEPA